MGGRGSRSGSSKNSATLKSALGPKRFTRETWDESLIRSSKNVNPNYGKEGKKYTHNCQRCVYAYEMSRRGYDVEALSYQGRNDIMFDNGRWMKMFEGQTWERNLGTRATSVQKKIESLMAGYGVGARAVVYVAWKTGSAHVFNVEMTELGLKAIDAQPGKANFDISDYLNDAKPTKTMISRVDHLKPKDDMALAVKRKERRK